MRRQLIDLRKSMKKAGIDAYLIPTTDFHGSEYVNDYFKFREFVSGFSGSEGTLLVFEDEAWLWTDGRYYLQADDQLKNTGIGLMRYGKKGVPSVEEYLKDKLSSDSLLGFDGRIVDSAFAERLEKICKIEGNVDLAGEIWKERPSIKPSEIYEIPLTVTGEATASKLMRIRRSMKRLGADYHLLTRLEDIAWIFNLRGSDIAHTPVFFSFALIGMETVRLYNMDPSFSSKESRPYFQIFKDIGMLPECTVLLDKSAVSYALVHAFPSNVKILNGENPTEMMKAKKNATEIKSTVNAHLKDGAAMVNFIYWLKHSICRDSVTETSAAEYLEKCRREQEGCYDLSFQTIAGYMENGAIVHNIPIPGKDRLLKAEGFFLIDSGGQYCDGTTDITRTIVLGPISRQMQEHYTAVLRCHIRLAMNSFPHGTTGRQLDYVAREPLNKLGLDYNHGTGHGVGHMLSVHEGPHTISQKPGCDIPFDAGMITSDEPGLYIEGVYGIRLENELLCIKKNTAELGFLLLTWCPFDRAAILPEQMTQEEIHWLNEYHLDVYRKIAPRVSKEVAKWLEAETAPI